MDWWIPIRSWVIVGLASLMTLAACDEDERAEPYEVTELRVLAVRAEPPELTDQTPIQFDALVVSGIGELTYSWRLCPFTGPSELSFPCLADLIPEEDLSQIPEEILPCVIGETGDEAIFTATPCPYDTYAFFLEAAAQDQGFPLELDPETGIEMTVRLQVSDETGRVVDAIKAFSVTQAETPNSNPSLTGVVVQDEPEQAPEQGEPWTEEQVRFIGLEEAPILQVTYDESVAELVGDPKDPSQESEPEELLFTWYATSGVFERGRTAPDLMDNEFRPDGDSASGDDRIWVVIRDGRGGIGWLERRFTIMGVD